jgi:hypothetical protein
MNIPLQQNISVRLSKSTATRLSHTLWMFGRTNRRITLYSAPRPLPNHPNVSKCEALPFVADPDRPDYDGPTPDEIEGPFTEDAIPPAVKDSETAATMRDDMWSDSPPEYLVAAEEQANTAVESAENAGELCWGLRDNPGAHKDVTKSMEPIYAHLPASLVSNEQDNSNDLLKSHDNDQKIGLGL